MSAPLPRPSRVALRLLRLVSSRDAANATIGDLFEELEARRATGHAPRWPQLWMWLQTWRFVLAAIRTGIPRLANTLGLCVRDAARALRRSPSHALFILIILAVGISAATVTFSVVDAVVLKPLPFEQGDDIVNISVRTERFANGPLSVEEFWAIHDRVT